MSSISSELDVGAAEEAEEMEVTEVQSRNYNYDDSSENKENEEMQEENSPQLSCSPSNANEDSLLQLVRNKRLRSKDICKDWIRHYGLNSEAALIKLMEFILEASGSQYKLPRDLKPPFNYMEILITATAQFGNKSAAYPLIMKTADQFVQDICNFVEQLLQLLSATSIISDDCFLKTISDFLMVCSDSKVRPFRHTSTLIALKLMTLLNGLVAWEQTNLREIWLQMFAKVFLARSNDVVEDIRHLCIAECGLWLDKYPESFVDLHQVQHLYQALQDSCSKVCEASLQALLRLYHNPRLRPVCLEQGIKFRMTLLGLTMSEESELGQMSIQLLIMFYRLTPQILDESLTQVIEQLVFAAHRGIAQAAADLIPFRYHCATTDKERIRVLVQFFIQFGQHEHAAYFVDAFYGCNDIILDWNSMLSMLLQPESMSSQEISVLIEIMTRAVKQAVTGEVPVGRYTKDLVRNPHPHAKKQAPKILLPKLPTLLRQYRSCSQDLRNLLELPQYMNLLRTQLLEVLEPIKDIMFEQEDESVLQMGAKTLEHLYGMKDWFADHRKELLNNAVSNYKSAVNDWDQSKDNPGRLVVTLRLLSALYARFDLHDWQLAEQLLSTLKQVARNPTENSLPNEAIDLYLSIFYVALSWDLKRAQDLAKAGKDVAEECHALRNRLKDFLVVNFTLIQISTDAKVANNAFVYTCDLFVLFADALRKSCIPSIQALEYKSKPHDYELLEEYLQRYVFAGADEGAAIQLLEPEQFSMLQSKRRVLVSYLKLVFHNVMPMMRACVVYQYYEQYHPVFGDILRATMERSLAMNPTNFGMTVMHTCLLVYKRIRETYSNSVQAAASMEFAQLLRLANLLAELFHIKQLEVRQGILILHRAGIRFAAELTLDDPSAAPRDLLYLSVLQQFVPQLLAQDMLDVFNFLQFIDQTSLPSRADEWQPLLSYRNSLEIALRQSCRREDLNDIPSYTIE
ncbi:hypothetical protein ACLKA7_016335 [Drosophila subpalustris]